MNIIGSTLEDLSFQLNCPVQSISKALSVRTILNFLSGLLGIGSFSEIFIKNYFLI